MQVCLLDFQEDPLEEAMATHSSILPWRIPWTEEPGSYSPWGCKESDRTEAIKHTHAHTHTHTHPTQKNMCPERGPKLN